jgi:hypothetical protein
MCKSSIYIHILGSLSASRVGRVKKQTKNATGFGTSTRIKKPAPRITGGGSVLLTWEIIYFLTIVNFGLGLIISTRLRRCLFFSALRSRYIRMNHATGNPNTIILSSNGIARQPFQCLRFVPLFFG